MTEDVSEIQRRIEELVFNADLETATVKAIRTQLEKEMNMDLSSRKTLITDLIKSSLEKKLSESPELFSSLVMDGKEEYVEEEKDHTFHLPSNDFIHCMSKEEQEEADRKLALELQKVESSNKRSLRQTTALISRKMAKKKLKETSSSANVVPKKKKSTFPSYKVSESLSEFLNGEESTTSSQITKELWAYIKENNLQDTKDKRFIFCDEKLKKIFGGKSRIHMFHISREIHKHLYPMN